MDDFSEITGVVKKLIQHEMAKGRKDPAITSQADEINSLKRALLDAKSEIEDLKRDRDRLLRLVGDTKNSSGPNTKLQQKVKRTHLPALTVTTSPCKRQRATTYDAMAVLGSGGL